MFDPVAESAESRVNPRIPRIGTAHSPRNDSDLVTIEKKRSTGITCASITTGCHGTHHDIFHNGVWCVH